MQAGSSRGDALDRRRIVAATAVAIAVAIGLRIAALEVGYFQDDGMQIAMLEGAYPGDYAGWDLFRFADLERHGRVGIDAGSLPWWSSPDLRIAMFRPLASTLIALDHFLFELDPRAAHLQSLIWLAACVAAFALALSELFGMPVIALGLLLFSVDESFSTPVAWIANRSYLVVATLGWLGVWAHLRARRAARPAATRAAEALLFSLALAGGEYALAMLAYPIALELFRAQAPWRARVVALVPAIGPGLLYLALRSALDFGTRGSGFYLDPAATPGAFALALLERLPTLATRLVFVVQTPGSAVTTGVIAAALLLGAAYQLSHGAATQSHRAVLAMAFGALLSLVPTVGALPDERLLVAACGGVAVVIASVALAAWTGARAAFQRGATLRAIALAAFAIGVLGLHGIGAALRSRTSLATFAKRAHAEWQWAQGAEIPADPEARIVFLSGADFTTNAGLVWIRRLDGHPTPRSCWRLSPYALAHGVERVADAAIEVTVLQGASLPFANSLYRSDATPLAAGDVVELDGMRVTVLEAHRGEPMKMRFEFDQSLDDAQMVFLHATPRGLRRIALPPVGGKLRLPAPFLPGRS